MIRFEIIVVSISLLGISLSIFLAIKVYLQFKKINEYKEDIKNLVEDFNYLRKEVVREDPFGDIIEAKKRLENNFMDNKLSDSDIIVTNPYLTDNYLDELERKKDTMDMLGIELRQSELVPEGMVIGMSKINELNSYDDNRSLLGIAQTDSGIDNTVNVALFHHIKPMVDYNIVEPPKGFVMAFEDETDELIILKQKIREMMKNSFVGNLNG